MRPPDEGTVGRFFLDADGRLWLHEWTIPGTAVCLMDGFFQAIPGAERPERKYVSPGVGEPGLVMLDEPITKTLAQLRAEGRLAA